MTSKSQRRTYLALFNATYELILEKGYDAVTIAEIARRADYGRSTFYLHFQDKADVVWKMIEAHAQILDEQLIDLVGHLEFPLREWRAWQLIFMSIDQQRLFFQQLDSDFSWRLRQRQKALVIENYQKHLKAGFYSLDTDVPIAISARFITGGLVEILDYWLDHPDAGTPDEMTDMFFQLVFRQLPPNMSKSGEKGS